MLKKLLLALALLSSATFTPHVATVLAAPHQACCGAITPEGYRLIDLIDAMNVEKLWLAHQHVNWETGESDRPADYNGPGNHTHCSAFAAENSIRSRTDSAEKPPKTTLWGAPIRAQASIATTTSGIIGR